MFKHALELAIAPTLWQILHFYDEIPLGLAPISMRARASAPNLKKQRTLSKSHTLKHNTTNYREPQPKTGLNEKWRARRKTLNEVQ